MCSEMNIKKNLPPFSLFTTRQPDMWLELIFNPSSSRTLTKSVATSGTAAKNEIFMRSSCGFHALMASKELAWPFVAPNGHGRGPWGLACMSFTDDDNPFCACIGRVTFSSPQRLAATSKIVGKRRGEGSARFRDVGCTWPLLARVRRKAATPIQAKHRPCRRRLLFGLFGSSLSLSDWPLGCRHTSRLISRELNTIYITRTLSTIIVSYSFYFNFSQLTSFFSFF